MTQRPWLQEARDPVDFVRKVLIAVYAAQARVATPTSGQESDWKRCARDVRLANLRKEGDERKALPAWEPLTQHARNAVWAMLYAKHGLPQTAHTVLPDVFILKDNDHGKTAFKVQAHADPSKPLVLTSVRVRRTGLEP